MTLRFSFDQLLKFDFLVGVSEPWVQALLVICPFLAEVFPSLNCPWLIGSSAANHTWLAAWGSCRSWASRVVFASSDSARCVSSEKSLSPRHKRLRKEGSRGELRGHKNRKNNKHLVDKSYNNMF